MPENVHKDLLKAVLLTAVLPALAAVVTVAAVAARPALGLIVVTVAAIVVAVVLAFELRQRDVASGARRCRVFSSIGRLLPAEVRDEYCEEWAAWMADLRADGTPRVRRWLELLSLVLIAVPRLVVGLRWAAVRRAVGR